MTRSEWLKDALQLPLPEDHALVLDGCRRLLGPNLFSVSPGAVGDALCPDRDPEAVLQIWLDHVRGLLDDLAWQDASLTGRYFDGGASVFLAAAVDRLFSAAYVIEAGWYFCACGLLEVNPIPREPLLAELRSIFAHEANTAFAALVAEAETRGVDRLLDDDMVTFGHGKSSVTWAIDSLPVAPDWHGVHDLPLALVTGTNGKTTTTRLIAAMAGAAGLVSGLSSTEFVKVGDEILEQGDYAGPAGAKLLLRDQRLELAALEVARGGILRRGLPVTRALVAVVTNAAAGPSWPVWYRHGGRSCPSETYGATRAAARWRACAQCGQPFRGVRGPGAQSHDVVFAFTADSAGPVGTGRGRTLRLVRGRHADAFGRVD